MRLWCFGVVLSQAWGTFPANKPRYPLLGTLETLSVVGKDVMRNFAAA
jgi:hypothetical protein